MYVSINGGLTVLTVVDKDACRLQRTYKNDRDDSKG